MRRHNPKMFRPCSIFARGFHLWCLHLRQWTGSKLSRPTVPWSRRRIIDVHHGKTLPIIRDMEHRVAGRWNLCMVSSALAPLSHELWFSWNGGVEDPLICSSHRQKLHRTCSGREFRGICFRGFAILFVTTSLLRRSRYFSASDLAQMKGSDV